MRCGCLLVVASLFLIVMGIQGIHEAHAFTKPVDITAEQFMLSAPPEGWYRIKGGEIDVTDSVYIVTTYHSKGSSSTDDAKEPDTDKTADSNKHTEKDAHLNSDQADDKPAAKTEEKPTPKDKPKPHPTKKQEGTADKTEPSSEGDKSTDSAKGNDTSSDTTADDNKKITEVYIPVHCPSQWKEQTNSYPPTNIVIKTSDPGIIETANQLKHIDDMKPDEQEKWVEANKDKLVLRRDIEGMVQAGLHADTETRALLSKDQDNLTPGYQIVEEGLKPSMSGGFGTLFGGILLGICSILYWGSYLFRWKRRLT